MNDAKKLLADMKALGIKEGETILVHASMKALRTKETPETVLDTLQKALGENGTLLLPALTYENVTPEHPVFDADKTVPCIGLLPRTFWKMPGVVRSVHPTHSVCARGKRAAELTALHGEDITPVGKNSPFMKLPEIGGRLLFIGEVLDCCTFMHGVEERFGTDYVLTKEKIRYVVNGEEKYMYGHDFKGRVDKAGIAEHMARVDHLFRLLRQIFTDRADESILSIQIDVFINRVRVITRHQRTNVLNEQSRHSRIPHNARKDRQI